LSLEGNLQPQSLLHSCTAAILTAKAPQDLAVSADRNPTVKSVQSFQVPCPRAEPLLFRRAQSGLSPSRLNLISATPQHGNRRTMKNSATGCTSRESRPPVQQVLGPGPFLSRGGKCPRSTPTFTFAAALVRFRRNVHASEQHSRPARGAVPVTVARGAAPTRTRPAYRHRVAAQRQCPCRGA